MNKPRTAHRLDCRTHRLVRIVQSLHQRCQTIDVRRDRTSLTTIPVRQENVEVETLAAEIQSNVQHEHASSARALSRRAESARRGGPPSWDSVVASTKCSARWASA